MGQSAADVRLQGALWWDPLPTEQAGARFAQWTRE
jgi:hypothetical protein